MNNALPPRRRPASKSQPETKRIFIHVCNSRQRGPGANSGELLCPPRAAALAQALLGLFAILCGLIATTPRAIAQFLAIPRADNYGGINTLVRENARTGQYVYGASLLASVPLGTAITGMGLSLNVQEAWPPASRSWSHYDVQLSKSLRAPGFLSTTFSKNIGADVVTVRSGPLMIPAEAFLNLSGASPLVCSIVFSTPYIYTGGDLLVTIRHSGNGVDSNYINSIAAEVGSQQGLYTAAADAYTASTSQGSNAVPLIQFTTVTPQLVIEQPPGKPRVASGSVVGWGEIGDGATRAPQGLTGVQAIAAGGKHTLALKEDGTVLGWGSNSSGQTNIPAGLSGVRSIAAGGTHSVALTNEGNVIVWGGNDAGQAIVPPGLAGVQAIAAGLWHTMALRSDGTVVAWGGRISVPEGLTGVRAIAAGGSFSMALRSDGTVATWGSAGLTEVPAGLTDVQAIAAGLDHALALKGDGTLVAWGYNYAGSASIPSGLTGVRAIAAGLRHTVALTSDGTVTAWGDSLDGQTSPPEGLSGVLAISAGNTHTVALVRGTPPVVFDSQPLGIGSAAKPFVIRNSGVLALNISSAIFTGANPGDFRLETAKLPASIPAGGQITLGVVFTPGALGVRSTALRVLSDDPTNADVVLTGIGTNSTAPAITPHPDAGPVEATSALGAIVNYPPADARDHAGAPVAISYSQASGTIFPVGISVVVITATDAAGQVSTSTFSVLVQDTTPPMISPTTNITLEASDATGAWGIYPPSNASDAATSAPVVTYSKTRGTRFPIGVTTVNVTATDMAKNKSVASFTVTVQDTTAPVIKAHPNVIAAATAAAGAPVNFSPATATDAVTTSPLITYSQNSGTVFPRGVTTVTIFAKDGSNNTATATFTVTVADLPILAVEQPLGTPRSGKSSIVTWGNDILTQTGMPYGLTDAQAVSTGDGFTVALKSNGTVAQWGVRAPSLAAAGVPDIQAIAAGEDHVIAIKTDGTVVAWGENSYGQTSVPAGLIGVQAIAAGHYHSVALKNDGTVAAWGDNAHGQTNVPSGLKNVRAIAAGWRHTAALKSDGTVVVWGAYYGVSNGSPEVQAIAAAGEYTAALKRDGSVFTGYTAYVSAIPAGLSGVQAIAAGGSHMVALKSDSTVAAWGNNGFGQTNVPAGLMGVQAISSGFSHTAALLRETPPVAFGSQNLGSRSAASIFTLKNTGAAPLIIADVSLFGGNRDDFSVDTTGMLASVPVGGQTTLGITFKPGALDQRGTTLHLLVNNPANPSYDVALTGIGIDTTPPVLDPHSGAGRVNAASADGAIVTYPAATASDNSGEAPSITYSRASGTLFPVGLTTVTITATDASGNAATAAFNLSVSLLPALESWRLSHFGITSNTGSASNLADPDGDGIVNLLEFAFDTNPLKMDAPATSVITASAGMTELRITFVRRADYEFAGLAYQVESSADLKTWIPVTAAPTLLAEDGQLQIVSVLAPAIEATLQPASFFRVRATLNSALQSP